MYSLVFEVTNTDSCVSSNITPSSVTAIEISYI